MKFHLALVLSGWILGGRAGLFMAPAQADDAVRAAGNDLDNSINSQTPALGEPEKSKQQAVVAQQDQAKGVLKSEKLWFDPFAGYTNSLGMRFLPVPGTTVLFSIWETRVQDYAAFCTATSRAPAGKPVFAQEPTHPVVHVSWEDAKAFCDWLTIVERRDNRLTGKERYRLPTDFEWSSAAAVGPEQGKTPEDRMKTPMIWPWGSHWPPVSGDGNYAAELKADSFAYTSPAGSFKTNANGLFDIGGNVWEWCGDWFNEARVSMTMRGGSFSDGHPAALLSSYRFNGTMNLTSEDIGFRVVLERAGR